MWARTMFGAAMLLLAICCLGNLALADDAAKVNGRFDIVRNALRTLPDVGFYGDEAGKRFGRDVLFVRTDRKAAIVSEKLLLNLSAKASGECRYLGTLHIVGAAHLTRGDAWSFTLRDKDDPTMIYRIVVDKDKDGKTRAILFPSRRTKYEPKDPCLVPMKDTKEAK